MNYNKLNEYKDSILTRNNIAYASMSLAAFIMTVKFLFSGRSKQIQYDEKSKKRRKIVRKAKRLFDFKNENNPQLKFVKKEHNAIDNFSKLKEYTGTMVNKVLNKEEVLNPKTKQDYIFYQILNGMQTRFKQKTLMN